jgi:hypothetical protein
MPPRLCVPLALLLLTGCGSSTGPGGDPPPILSELPRALSPSELRIAAGANAFAFDLLREVAKALPPDSNAFLSPLSASMALGMTLSGANGPTYDAMRSTLRLDGMVEAEINQGYRGLMTLLGGLDPQTTAAGSIKTSRHWGWRWRLGRVRTSAGSRTWADSTSLGWIRRRWWK